MNFTISDLGGIFSFVCAIIAVIIGAVILFGALFIDFFDRKENNSKAICHKILYIKDTVVLTRCFAAMFTVYTAVELFCRYYTLKGITTGFVTKQLIGFFLTVIPILFIGFHRKKQLGIIIKENSQSEYENVEKICKRLFHLTRQIALECIVCTICVLTMAFSLAFLYIVMTDISNEL